MASMPASGYIHGVSRERCFVSPPIGIAPPAGSLAPLTPFRMTCVAKLKATTRRPYAQRSDTNRALAAATRVPLLRAHIVVLTSCGDVRQLLRTREFSGPRRGAPLLLEAWGRTQQHPCGSSEPLDLHVLLAKTEKAVPTCMEVISNWRARKISAGPRAAGAGRAAQGAGAARAGGNGSYPAKNLHTWQSFVVGTLFSRTAEPAPTRATSFQRRHGSTL